MPKLTPEMAARIAGSARPRPVDLDALPQARDSAGWRVPIAPHLAGELRPLVPDMLMRADGSNLLYAGKRHSIAGEPESGKSWFALMAVLERIVCGDKVVYLDFETSAATILGRLRSLGATDEAMVEGLTYANPDVPSEAEIESLVAEEPTLIVIDAVTEACALYGLDSDKGADYAKWARLMLDPLRSGGAATLQIDHVTKSKDGRGRGPIGSQHKLAYTDVQLLTEVVEPFAPGRQGVIKVLVSKDREGGVRGVSRSAGGGADLAAVMRLDSTGAGGRVIADLGVPSGADAPDRGTGPDPAEALVDAVVAVVGEHQPLRAGPLREAVRAKFGKVGNTAVDEAKYAALRRGLIHEDKKVGLTLPPEPQSSLDAVS